MVEANTLICCLFADILPINSLNGLYAITISAAKLHIIFHIHKFSPKNAQQGYPLCGICKPVSWLFVDLQIWLFVDLKNSTYRSKSCGLFLQHQGKRHRRGQHSPAYWSRGVDCIVFCESYGNLLQLVRCYPAVKEWVFYLVGDRAYQVALLHEFLDRTIECARGKLSVL